MPVLGLFLTGDDKQVMPGCHDPNSEVMTLSAVNPGPARAMASPGARPPGRITQALTVGQADGLRRLDLGGKTAGHYILC